MNKHLLRLAAASAAALFGAAAHAQVGVSIGINQPGVYGRVTIGEAPPPVIYQQPLVVEQSPVVVHRRPIYLYVPDAYAHDWRHHCAEYAACGQPVYFVQDQWVRERYAQRYPHWQERGAPGYYRPDPRGWHDHGPDRGDWHGRGDHDHDHGDHGDRGDRGHHDGR